MTIGNWVFLFGVLLLAFERPGASLVVLGIGVLPYIIMMLGKRSAWAALMGVGGYITAVVAVVMMLTPLNGDATNLILLFALAIIVLLSWGSALDME
jgi:hypothetical protein